MDLYCKMASLGVMGPILIQRGPLKRGTPPTVVTCSSLSEADFKVHLGEHDHTKSGESRVLVVGVKEYVFDQNTFLRCEYISGTIICLASSKTGEVHSWSNFPLLPSLAGSTCTRTLTCG